MKAVILAGGLGTRLSEETGRLPKPMIEIGGRPILWHIMNIYSAHGINDFVVCLGYRGYMIKEYFLNYTMHNSDITIDTKSGQVTVHQNASRDWRVTLVDTGADTMTGGRLRRIRDFVKSEEAFCFTYGDGVSDVNITELLEFHRSHGRQATITAITPPGRFGSLNLQNGKVIGFAEKRDNEEVLINGGYFVLSPEVIDHIESDRTTWEKEPMEILAEQGEMSAFHHRGFWHAMDTLRDKRQLEEMWASGNAPWKIW